MLIGIAGTTLFYLYSIYIFLHFTGTIVSIAFFNFAGISVTKEISATTRMVLDSIRTLVIWIFSLAIQWQVFHPLQLLGFFILIVGMCLYNDILLLPFMRNRGCCGRQQLDLQPIMEDAYDPEIRSVDDKRKEETSNTDRQSIQI